MIDKMIEHWCHEINDHIKQEVGVIELCGYDPSHDRHETYCETAVLFYMVGIPQPGYSLGLAILNDAVMLDLQSRIRR